MKKLVSILFVVSLVSCTGNTIYKKPENLIPRDTMVQLLVDMHIAAASKPVKNIQKKKDVNYMALVYEKYKIDSVRFNESNVFYTSKIDEYDKLLGDVKSILEEKRDMVKKELTRLDSIKFPKKYSDSAKAKKLERPEKLLKDIKKKPKLNKKEGE